MPVVVVVVAAVLAVAAAEAVAVAVAVVSKFSQRPAYGSVVMRTSLLANSAQPKEAYTLFSLLDDDQDGEVSYAAWRD